MNELNQTQIEVTKRSPYLDTIIFYLFGAIIGTVLLSVVVGLFIASVVGSYPSDGVNFLSLIWSSLLFLVPFWSIPTVAFLFGLLFFQSRRGFNLSRRTLVLFGIGVTAGLCLVIGLFINFISS